MTRILFWLALVFLVVHAIRSKLNDARQPRQQRQPPPQPQQRNAPNARQARAAAQAIAEAETMLCCAHCGIYYPSSENVRSDGRDYCSVAHAGLPAA
jgi:uncharacterized protein